MVKENSKEEMTVTCEPEKCIHSDACVEGLSVVYQLQSWIKIKAADNPYCDGSHKKPDFER